MSSTLFQIFNHDISGISLPEKFTFPFYYEPHELSRIAANELQNYLESQTDFEHNFGLDTEKEGLVIGKMFGVLVVQNSEGELGYLWAFSGKLADQNHLPLFVPTVFDMLEENSFFLIGIKELNAINLEVETLENNPEFLLLTETYQTEKALASAKLEAEKIKMSEAKKARKLQRKKAQTEITDKADLEIIMAELVRESLKDKFLFRELTEYLENQLAETKEKLSRFTDKINQLKEERSLKSAALQQQIFAEYSFLNQYKELKSLAEIFNGNPPAGAGECAAPKLLHYAFQHHLKPIAMAEFWWGQSPKSEVRKHGQFYPACTGKCEPILAHMLKDIPMDDNPFGINPAEGKELEVVFEDDYLAIVNKPAEFLSVPGKQVKDSVSARVASLYPNATGPLIVHRLDMATSGLLLIAKNIEIHKELQSQFIKRKVKKRYVALLDGLLKEDSGLIDLPLRVDLDNRPNQMVCYEHGKTAQTKWEVIERRNNQTLVYFYPITGRTHQLRVHAAHNLGLNTPIVGDDLYGTKANRLHLHAESITFSHPISKETVTVTVAAAF
ncbi:RNA pseudouridine synthase [Flavobacterium sp. J49]|uniref:RluA family pseudouridine synthase n=1 Tax=Flavobacterium sp. J49 TaxID=2718534 RepID=UPI001593BC7C|nr:RluA family pseudouridine synthase [Flavobacterium sp. J49]MBF6640877.1 RNA pseudouridine synthase [Flavobacterium sp. J49]NIC02124.1 RNA pseudouridine synthase [Flavobacterium sp. J49]